jgi:hypothetical protein
MRRDGWVVACRHVWQRGRFVVAELRVHCDGAPVPEGGLSKRWLVSAIAIGNHLRAADRRVHRVAVAPLVVRVPPGFALAASPGAPRRRGRPRIPDAVLAPIIAAYDDAQQRESTHPIRDVAARLGLRELARVRMYVHRARQRRLLTGAGQGHARGRLTPEGHALVRRWRRQGARTSTKRKGSR